MRLSSAIVIAATFLADVTTAVGLYGDYCPTIQNRDDPNYYLSCRAFPLSGHEWYEKHLLEQYTQLGASPRNPTFRWDSNHADLIESQLKDDKHQVWGFVIYRTTYANDYDWQEFLCRLRFSLEDTFDFWNGRDILDKFQMTVVEDPNIFDGASTAKVREHFRQWAIKAYRHEQQPGERGDGPNIGRSPRYRFAVQVDAASLYSIVHLAPAPPALDSTDIGWVKVVDKSWYLGRSEWNAAEAEEPLEGITERDVGWMMVPYQTCFVDFYYHCRDPIHWTRFYRRPTY